MKRFLLLVIALVALTGCQMDPFFPPPVPPDPTPTPTPPDPKPPEPQPRPVVEPVANEVWKRVTVGMTLADVQSILQRDAYRISPLGLADGRDPATAKTGYAWYAILDDGTVGFFEVHFVKGVSVVAFPFQ